MTRSTLLFQLEMISYALPMKSMPALQLQRWPFLVADTAAVLTFLDKFYS
jgi:hypothetical protein